MKLRRQMKILEVVRDRHVETQHQLTEALREDGIEVTQATVSRDIKDLRLVKVPGDNGRYRYAVPEDPASVNRLERLRRYLQDSLVNMDVAENLVVVRTLPGTANAVASGIDGLNWPEVVGTLAGDDTILVVARDKVQAPGLLARLRELGR
ncbi:MAG: arginine repressor [bacterium]|nr:arginine repressor [bacterium]